MAIYVLQSFMLLLVHVNTVLNRIRNKLVFPPLDPIMKPYAALLYTSLPFHNSLVEDMVIVGIMRKMYGHKQFFTTKLVHKMK